MKTPLRYQFSEYDCGPACLQNAISYLFDREEIPPEVLRNISLYCLDGYSAEGISGKTGTSATAMMFLSNWLTSYGKTGRLPVACRYLSGAEVHLEEGSQVLEALRQGGTVVQRLILDVGHYILLTGVEGDCALAFDPYHWEGDYDDNSVEVVWDHPDTYNRRIPLRLLNSGSTLDYALGPVEKREAVLIFNTKTTPAAGDAGIPDTDMTGGLQEDSNTPAGL